MTDTQNAAPAAWYPDGAGSRLRYWDGAAWTDFYAEPAVAPVLRASPPKPLHPAALATILIGVFTLVTILVVVVVYFIGVPAAPIPRIGGSSNGAGTSSIQG